MDSRYNYENRPTNAQMKTQWNIQYAVNHMFATIEYAWNSLTFIQKIVLVGIIAFIIYFIIKLIKQQMRWRSIGNKQTEPVFLDDLRWDSGEKKVYIGNVPYPVIPAHVVPASGSYTYSFWLFMNGQNPFVPGVENAVGTANIRNRKYAGQVNNIFYRGGKWVSKQSPGVWFGGQTNDKLYIQINLLGKDEIEMIVIDDIPINEWLNVTFTVSGKTVNVYFNGQLERSVLLASDAMPPTKGSNLYIGNIDNGFPGEMAYFQYYNSVLSTSRIENIYDYYKRKIDEFMQNVNYWHTTNKTVPAVPMDLKCIPEDDTDDGTQNVDNMDSWSAMLKGEMSNVKGDIRSETKKFKTDASASGNGSASSGTGTSVMGDLKGDVANMKKQMSGNKSEGVKKLDSWEDKFKSYL